MARGDLRVAGGADGLRATLKADLPVGEDDLDFVHHAAGTDRGVVILNVWSTWG